MDRVDTFQPEFDLVIEVGIGQVGEEEGYLLAFSTGLRVCVLLPAAGQLRAVDALHRGHWASWHCTRVPHPSGHQARQEDRQSAREGLELLQGSYRVWSALRICSQNYSLSVEAQMRDVCVRGRGWA